MTQRSRTQSLVLTGLSIALIAVGAIITVPFGPIPFTLQTLMLGIVICLLPPKYSVAAVGGYLALGSLGLPIFSGMRGGFAVLAGPTGGFLVGFLVAAVIVAFIRSRALHTKDDTKEEPSRPRWFLPTLDISSLVLFSLISYVMGCLWFMYSTGTTLEASLAACVIPFLVPDAFKAAAALICIQPVRAALGFSPAPSS
ncbi:MAG: biotin transporter BioY [Coriobacteriia bacterium]|nr:biotin transporter BioY [Coriobacteriia bacterium]